MADGPCAEEAPSELASVNRVPKERHKCSNSNSNTNSNSNINIIGNCNSNSSNVNVNVNNEVVINIDKEALGSVRVTESDNNKSCVSVILVDQKKCDVYVDNRYDNDDDYDDDDIDDIDDDEDDDDDDDDDDGDDEDEVSSSSIISGCVSDEVLLGSTTTTTTKTTVVHKPIEETTSGSSGIVVILNPVNNVNIINNNNNNNNNNNVNVRKTVNVNEDRATAATTAAGVAVAVAVAPASLLGEITGGTTIRGIIIPEPKRGAAVKTIEKEQQNNGGTKNNFKGQIRTAEDTLVGPCGKKRCVDRYDSSESSDSGVAVSCGECSSSGTSDITEPGSPCSTSSDEGVAGIRSTAPSPTHKLAPPTPPPSRGPQWPWTPPLAATACSTLKKIKGEPEAGTLPKAGAADPTNCRGKSQHHHHHHHHHHDVSNGGISSTQGKITEYFKTQIKPQQVKVKKSLDMSSLLVAKSSPEFRRPPTVQRNKVGLAKYLGGVPPNGRANSSSDWEVRTLTMSPPPTKKQQIIVPRTHQNKIEKLQNPLPSLPISTNVLNALPTVKLSSLRLPSDVSPDPKINSTTTLITPLLNGKTTDFDDDNKVFAKPAVNENNNLTSTIIAGNRSSIQNDHLSRLSPLPVIPIKDIEEQEEPKQSSLSPILSAPTTIRFPAQAPGKNRPQTTDSGICRWDQCDARFDSSSGLLEHLQVSHINTQTGGDNFICHWQGCKVQGRTSCSRRWLERHVLSHGGNKPFRCIVDGCGSRFSSQITLERHVNGHFNQPETSSSSGRKSCENGGKLVRRNGKRLRYRRQPWSARLFDFIDTGVMEGLQHRLLELARTRTQGRLAETPGDAMALTSQVLARRVEQDGKTKVLLRWYPQDIAPDEWVLESEVQETKHVRICNAAASSPDEVNLALYPAINTGTPPQTRTKQRRKPVKNS